VRSKPWPESEAMEVENPRGDTLKVWGEDGGLLFHPDELPSNAVDWRTKNAVPEVPRPQVHS
jgi:hypothetical protein